MRSQVFKQEEELPPGFDLVTHKRDPKTGEVVSVNPYILRVVGTKDGSKTQYFERPVGSGNIFNKKGDPIGRWLKDEETGRERFVEGAAHVKVTPPETEDQKLARALNEKSARIQDLEKELALIRAENKKKQGS